MSKMTKKELSAMGSKIMAKAKAIRKEHPNKKWQSCVKEAGKACKKKIMFCVIIRAKHLFGLGSIIFFLI